MKTELNPELIQAAADTLKGDMRDFILERLTHEHYPIPWQDRAEDHQRATIASVDNACEHFVTKAVRRLAGGSFPAIAATLDKIATKDEIQAVLKVPLSHEQRHDLYDAVGHVVLLVIADPQQFFGERQPVKVKPDQPNLLPEA
jgi:hypothetical protein